MRCVFSERLVLVLRLCLVVLAASCSSGTTEPLAPCSDGTCVADAAINLHGYDFAGAVLSPTGGPCKTDSDCDGSWPSCFLSDADGVVWPGGYCASNCSPQDNDPFTGLNGDCPGVNATCSSRSHCETMCTSKTGTMPCPRPGYSCLEICGTFCSNVCEPTAYSMCDPTKCGAFSCPVGDTCIRGGFDDVGFCTPRCDPFAPQCNQGEGCFPFRDCGDAECFPAGGAPDGAACKEATACAAGLACSGLIWNNQGICRPICGGLNNRPCSNGKTCIDFSPTVKATTLGVCAG